MARMRFIPKSNMSDVRMITRSEGSKTLDRSLVSLLRNYSNMFQAKTDLSGNILSERWNNLVLALDSEKKLFWITADISDAFGSIRQSKLCEILTECRQRLSSSDGQGRERTERLKKRMMLHTVMLRCGGRRRVFLLKRGVLQGDPLSSSLSDIYYGHMVSTELSQFLSPPPDSQEIFLRGADDFLFVSTEKSR